MRLVVTGHNNVHSTGTVNIYSISNRHCAAYREGVTSARGHVTIQGSVTVDRQSSLRDDSSTTGVDRQVTGERCSRSWERNSTRGSNRNVAGECCRVLSTCVTRSTDVLEVTNTSERAGTVRGNLVTRVSFVGNLG